MPNPGDFKRQMLEVFRSKADIKQMGFLTTFFKTGPKDITDAEFVSYDVVRTEEDAAPVLRDYTTGAVTISQDLYTNKTIKPPIYALDEKFNAFDLIRRRPGEEEGSNFGNWLGKLMLLVSEGWEKMFGMIKRGLEVQASQILQTATLNLNDDKGNLVYVLDYKPKVAHFPTVSTSWSDTANAVPLDDIDTLAETIRDNGKRDTKILIMGKTAFGNFVRNDDVQNLLDNRRINIGEIAPRLVNKGATYQGFIKYKNYQYEIWTYGGRFVDFFTRVNSKYIDDDKVVFLPDMDDLHFRKVFGGIPQILDSMPPFKKYMPRNVSIFGIGKFAARVYTDDKADAITTEVKARAILIPSSIDRFGCLDTQI